jgi:hypothetical protein
VGQHSGTAPPNLFLIGAAKAGTTTLAHQLGRHPEVFACEPKEPGYFTRAIDLPGVPAPSVFADYPFATTWDEYLALFAEGGGARWRLDASTAYLRRAEAAPRIAARLPDAQILAILRDPADRAYSHWSFWTEHGVEHLGFDDAITAELAGTPLRNGVDRRYVGTGRYGEHLSRYFEHFPAERIRVFDYDQLRADPAGLYQAIFVHLDLDPVAVDANRALNVTSLPRIRRLDGPLRSAGRWVRAVHPSNPAARQVHRVARKAITVAANANRRPAPPMSAATRRRVLDLLRDDIRALDPLVPWSALRWLEPAG